MSVAGRDGNVLYVSFNARPPASTCENCPFRRCCTCAHWERETQECVLGTHLDAGRPATAEDDWCGRWAPCQPKLVTSPA